MRIHDKSYPHPVLAPFRDDVTPNAFDIVAATTSDPEYYYFQIEFVFENETLEKLVLDGRASFALHVECKRNFFREIFRFSTRQSTLKVRSDTIVGRTEICAFVCAETRLENYSISGSHPDYGASTFTVSAGDILAVAPTLVIDAYNDYDRLTTLSSILDIERSLNDAEVLPILSFEGERILATLPQRDFEKYVVLKADPQIAPVIANQVIVPVLLEAIYYITRTEQEDIESELGKHWFRSIVEKLRNENIDILLSEGREFEAMNTLLQLPLHRSLTILGDAMIEVEE